MITRVPVGVEMGVPKLTLWARQAATAINQLASQKLRIKPTVSAAYTLEADYDVIPADTTGAAFTITLPKAALHKGRLVFVKRINGGANNLTVDGDGAETIDGAANITLTAQWEVKRLTSDGTNWLTL
jgi:hypothetical protein